MTPPNEHIDDTQRLLEAELRMRAAAALAGPTPAVLAAPDGRVLAANPAAGLSDAARLPAETATRLARIAATLRPGRPRLERLRLPGAMAPATLACTLIVAGGARAVLLAAPGAPVPTSMPDASPVVEPAASAPGPDVAIALPGPGGASEAPPEAQVAVGETAEAPAPNATATPDAPPASAPSTRAEPAVDEAPAPSDPALPPGDTTAATTPAPVPAAPARWFWRTDPEGRLRALDPRFAEKLGLPMERLAGRDWVALGAPALAQAVLAGGSFARLEVRLAAEDGGALLALFGGVPMRGDGMRGYALPLRREAAPAPSPVDTTTAATTSDAAAPPETAGPREPSADAGTAPASPSANEAGAPTPGADAGSPATGTATPPPSETVSLDVIAEIADASSDAAPDATDRPDDAPHDTDRSPPPAAPQPDEPAPVRVMLSIVPSSPNVVPLRAGAETSGETTRTSWAGLSAGERNAFREIARALGARLEGLDDEVPAPPPPPPHPAPAPEPVTEAAPPPSTEPDSIRRLLTEGERPVLDRLPLAVVAYRADKLLYANKALLEWSGHADLAALEAAGGLAALFRDSGGSEEDGALALSLVRTAGDAVPVEARLMSAPWDGGTAMLYILRRTDAGPDDRIRTAELALREAEAVARELRAILDTATDGVVLIDSGGVVLSMNRSAEALFGYESSELQGESFTLLFAPESRRAAVDYLDGLASNGVASVLNDGREVVGRVREGGLIPLFMTVGRIGEDGAKFCAVLRDITQWKRAEEELTEAKRLAEKANLAKSDFLAKISHEIRTPLNAIIGFSEVMMEERFGAIENERYRDYLRDIHASGGHLISLINDLLDLSKIEAGKLDLAFTSVPLNEIVQQCMAIMQGQANRERIIIRSQLAADLPPVVADPRSMRQIVLNLVSNSIKFSRPGGQVILSTALTEAGEVVLRVRDTGIGMSEGDIATAMEPFRQLATSGRAGSGGTGLGLPLTKALAEANRATFSIRSAVDAGTLVEITFPSTRVLAE